MKAHQPRPSRKPPIIICSQPCPASSHHAATRFHTTNEPKIKQPLSTNSHRPDRKPKNRSLIMLSNPSSIFLIPLFFLHLTFFPTPTISSPLHLHPIAAGPPPQHVSPHTASGCTPLTFLLRATALNTRFLHPPDPLSASSILSFLHSSYSNSTGPLTNRTHLIGRGGNRVFPLHATYCRPLSRPPGLPPRTLQVLVHGITYNQSIWSGLGLGHNDYDWMGMARARGYHVLAIDLLGHGGSSFSSSSSKQYDGVTEIQPPLQSSVLHSLIRLLRHGPINAPRKGWRNPLPYRFPRIVYVGHGYGSGLVVVSLVRKWPRDLDGVVQTSPIERSGLNESVVQHLMPAQMVDDGERFGRDLPLTYLAFRDGKEREKAFYAGFYDTATSIPGEDFRGQGTVTVGEAVYHPMLETREEEEVARGYRGPVMVVSGERDALFCGGQTGRDDDRNERDSCKKKLVEMGKRVWPGAKKVEVYVARETGHTWMMHYSAKITMWRIHNWLDGVFRRKMKDEEMVDGGKDGQLGKLVMQDEALDGYDRIELDGE